MVRLPHTDAEVERGRRLGALLRRARGERSMLLTALEARVSPETLRERGLVRKSRPVKVLGTGDIGVALEVHAHAFSGSARDKIAAAGGTATKL